MIIDFHTHTFPDQIAASAIARLSNNAHIEAHSNGTAGGLLLRLLRGERLIDLLKVALTHLRRQLIRLPARGRHRHLPDLRASIGLAAERRSALPRLYLLACRAQSPLLRQGDQRLIVGEGQRLRRIRFC